MIFIGYIGQPCYITIVTRIVLFRDTHWINAKYTRVKYDSTTKSGICWSAQKQRKVSFFNCVSYGCSCDRYLCTIVLAAGIATLFSLHCYTNGILNRALFEDCLFLVCQGRNRSVSSPVHQSGSLLRLVCGTGDSCHRTIFQQILLIAANKDLPSSPSPPPQPPPARPFPHSF